MTSDMLGFCRMMSILCSFHSGWRFLCGLRPVCMIWTLDTDGLLFFHSFIEI